MRALGYDEFVAAWATYWGRRDLGVVVANSIAERIASNPRVLRDFYDRWVQALQAYPADAALRLMGTPELTPELIERDARWAGSGAPRPAAIGPYADATSAGDAVQGPRSERAGDFETPVDPDSEGARAGRTLRRATYATPLNVLAVLTAWWLPWIALAAAIGSLALSISATRLFHAKRVPFRKYWGRSASQVVPVVAIVAAIIVIVPQLGSTGTSSKVEFAMTQSSNGSATSRVAARLRTHWPEAEIQVSGAPGDPDSIETIRVRVSEHVVLEARPSGAQWSVHPLTDKSGALVPVEPDRPYTIGVDVGTNAEELADRFYAEVYYWWVKLHPDVKTDDQGVPA